MNRFVAFCAITLAAGFALAHGTPSRPLDSREMESVRGGCYVLTSLPCTGATQACQSGGCYSNTSGSFCTYGGLWWVQPSGTYSGTATGNGLTSTKSGGNANCGTMTLCLNTCTIMGGVLTCNLGQVQTYTVPQTVPSGPACSGS